ncbi:MAG: response regulator [Lentisphaerae bacterium]|nr:response regulator [Lentisphaerota bacterium]
MKTGKSILLIDDDAEFCEATRAVLEADGYAVRVTHSGKEGLEAAQKSRPDLVILDVMMTTDTEGFDVSRQIKDTPGLAGMPVILMTGIRRELNLPFAFEPDDKWLPVKVVLEKPVPPQRLLAEVRKFIAGSKAG